MPLPQPDRLFIEQRRARRSFGLYILPLVLLVIIAAWVGLFMWWPSIVNPRAAVGEVEGQTVAAGTLSFILMSRAVMANIVLALLGAIVVLRIAWSSSERRYLKLIDKLETEQATHVPAGIAAPATPRDV